MKNLKVYLITYYENGQEKEQKCFEKAKNQLESILKSKGISYNVNYLGAE